MLHQVITQLDDVRARVGTVSVQIMDLASSDSAIDLISSSTTVSSSSTTSDELKWVIQLTTINNNNNNHHHKEELLSKVTSKYSQSMGGENRGSITLVDPTPEQLGLCYASCLKTDRSDGLFTTVVCTRSNEALGLVYSSKVSVCVFVFVYPLCFMCCSIFKTVINGSS
jgi:hypothetical protein